MRAVIQKVTKASVSVDGEIISEIGNGLCVFVGMKTNDNLNDVHYIVKRILNLKIFNGEDGKKWSASVVDKQYEILCISQFTLNHTIKGNKLDFHKAMHSSLAEPLYMNFLAELQGNYKSNLIKCRAIIIICTECLRLDIPGGKFGAMMKVNIENDGPVTLEIESPTKVM